MIEIIRVSEFRTHPKIRRILSRQSKRDEKVDRSVQQIIRKVRKEGDRALRDLTRRFDGVELRSIRIDPAEIQRQASRAPRTVRRALARAHRNLVAFHRRQVEKSWYFSSGSGGKVGQRLTPLESVGLYVPGGTAAYPSTILMNAVPAQVAGVKRLAVATPPKAFKTNPSVAAALHELGLDEVYAVGGAQAVAALAFGTTSIKPVDKIVGPGNQFVAAAKRMVFGTVDIDMIAGPTEVVIVADQHADPRWIAADLLAQSEHDPQASAVCVTNSPRLAEFIRQQVEELMSNLERRLICRQSIDEYGAVIVTHNLTEAEELVNEFAPEHVELHLKAAERFSRKIKHAGAIFLGHFSPEAVGDYFAGPNHVLPTSGTARFFSPLGVYDFVKRTSIIEYSKKRLKKDAIDIIALAEAEGLAAHAQSVRVRLQNPGSRSLKRGRQES